MAGASLARHRHREARAPAPAPTPAAGEYHHRGVQGPIHSLCAVGVAQVRLVLSQPTGGARAVRTVAVPGGAATGIRQDLLDRSLEGVRTNATAVEEGTNVTAVEVMWTDGDEVGRRCLAVVTVGETRWRPRGRLADPAAVVAGAAEEDSPRS